MAITPEPKCSVAQCSQPADFEVIHYDVYMGSTIFFEQDFTCPFLCSGHALENEANAKTFPKSDQDADTSIVSVADVLEKGLPDLVSAESTREYRGVYHYPYSNKGGGQGFTIYRPLKKS